jgi:hypothetical protein
MDVRERDNSKTVNTIHREVSSDGQSLIQTITNVQEHGPNKSIRKVFTRSSRPSGIAGDWTDPKELDRQPQVLITSVNGAGLYLSFPTEKEYVDLPLDGSEAPLHGTYTGARATLSAKPESAGQILILEKVNGVIVKNGTLTLSPDGQAITEETWRLDSPAVKTRLVYEK